MISWLFVRPQGGGQNGFSITGGVLNYTAEVTYPETGDKLNILFQFKVTQIQIVIYLSQNISIILVQTKSPGFVVLSILFQGLDVFDHLIADVNIVGTIPTVPPGAKIRVEDYHQQFSRAGPGKQY